MTHSNFLRHSSTDITRQNKTTSHSPFFGEDKRLFFHRLAQTGLACQNETYLSAHSLIKCQVELSDHGGLFLVLTPNFASFIL